VRRVLEITDLHSGYGRVPVLRGISLDVAPGEIVLVLGANGAGKSTLLRTVAGFLRPSQGSVRMDGAEIGGVAPEELARRGLRLVLDGHRVFPDMSVADNIRLGAALHGPGTDIAALSGPALDMFPVLREKFHQPARDLSGGQQQMLALTQAFVAKPRFLLCDEPSLGLALALLPPILQFLRRWAEQGVGILVVEQQIDLALSIADRAVVIDRGAIRLAGTADALRADKRVQEIYLGLEETE
jgi:branched-chain amino acid transport system ATP-binding protein